MATETARSETARLERRPEFALGPQYQFVSVYNYATSVYRQRFDEALRDDLATALAMWRNGLVQEQLGRRWRAGRRLRWHVEPDDPRNHEQRAAAQRYTKVLAAIPRFPHLRLALQERAWYGKAGANLAWGRTWVDGAECWSVVNHKPVNGDSIGFHHTGIPKIQVSATWRGTPGYPAPRTIVDDRGTALLLDTPFWRRQFAIGQFEPHAPDWGYEPAMALAMYGYGLRGRLYWTMWLHSEVMGWHLDALKRFGSNGQLYAFYDSGNDEARRVMLAALKQIATDSVAVFPREPGQEPGDIFHQIPAANIAYEVQTQFLDRMEGVVKRAICGTEETTGGSLGAAQWSQTAFGDVVACDAEEEGEILTREVLQPIVEANEGRLGFGLRVVVQPQQDDVGQRMAAIRMAVDMGMAVDVEDVYDIIGVAPPRDGANIVKLPQAQPGAGEGGPPGETPDLAADTGRAPSKNLVPGLEAELPREARSGGDSLSAHADADGLLRHSAKQRVAIDADAAARRRRAILAQLKKVTP